MLPTLKAVLRLSLPSVAVRISLTVPQAVLRLFPAISSSPYSPNHRPGGQGIPHTA